MRRIPVPARTAVAALALGAGLLVASPALAAATGQASHAAATVQTIRAGSSPWSIQASPPLDTSSPQAALSAVSCPSASACVAGGYFFGTNGGLGSLAEQWNGSSWQLLSVPSSLGGLTALSCQSLTSCVAIGGSRRLPGGGQVSKAGTWNGSTWQVMTTPRVGGFSPLTSLSCSSASFCMAVGERYGNANGRSLAERWNGTSWRIVASPNGPAGGFLSGISCRSADDCVAVGAQNKTVIHDRPLVARWNGSRWTKAGLPLPPGAASNGYLFDVSCPTAAACTAVGGYVPPGRSSQMLVEDLTGGHWRYSLPRAPKRMVAPALTDVSCSAPRVCTAVLTYLNNQTESSLTTTAARGKRGGFVVYGKSKDDTLSALSCRPAACMVAGYKGAGDDAAVPTTFAERGTGNSLTPVAAVDPAGTSGGQLDAVSCVESGFCAATAAGDLASDPTVEVR
jgi:hypothetical protein